MRSRAGTFLDEDAQQAARTKHLTARQAGLARRAGAKRVLPFHCSLRDAEREPDLRREVGAAWAGEAPAATPPRYSA